MSDDVRQQRDTIVSIEADTPSLTYGQIVQVVTQLYRLRPHELGKLTARVKKVQRSGIPLGANVGKGPRARYSLDQLFQLIVVLELAELSISLTIASDLVRNYWPGGPVSLAPAQAWIMHQADDSDSVLLLATTAEREGLSSYADVEEAATARAAAFVVGAPARPMDGLRSVLLSSVITDGKLDLSRLTLSSQLWRSSLIDCSVLVLNVARVLAASGLVSEEQFGGWARAQCDTFLARAEEEERLGRR